MEHPKPLILVIDDHEWFLESSSIVLSEQYACITAANGEQGLEKFQVKKPQLVLCDVKMEGELNGFAVCRQIKRISPDTPVILLTSYSDTDSRLAGLREGADAYLSKTTSNDELLLQIRNLLISQGHLSLTSDDEACEVIEEVISADWISNLKTVFDQILEERQSGQESSFSLEAVADAMHVSPRTLQRKFTATNTSFSEFRQGYLLESSLDLLAFDEPIERVAFLLGFDSHSHFTKIFKRKYGMTPSRYMQNKQQLEG